MGRPLRIQYPGALYHITSRGNERGKIFIDAGLKDEQGNPFITLHGRVILGDETFLEKTKKLLAGKRISREVVERKKLRMAPLPDKIITAVADTCCVKEEIITASGGKNNKARKIAMYLAYQYSCLGNTESASCSVAFITALSARL